MSSRRCDIQTETSIQVCLCMRTIDLEDPRTEGNEDLAHRCLDPSHAVFDKPQTGRDLAIQRTR